MVDAVVGRRRFLAGAGLALVAGCGKDLEPPVPPPAADALMRALVAARAAAAALDGLDARAPRRDRMVVRRLSERADARAQGVAAALAAAGGGSHDPSAPAGTDADPDRALASGRAAVAAHVEAMPSLRGQEQRRFGAWLVTESAGDLAVLGAVFGSRPAEAFPGTPT